MAAGLGFTSWTERYSPSATIALIKLEYCFLRAGLRRASSNARCISQDLRYGRAIASILPPSRMFQDLKFALKAVIYLWMSRLADAVAAVTIIIEKIKEGRQAMEERAKLTDWGFVLLLMGAMIFSLL